MMPKKANEKNQQPKKEMNSERIVRDSTMLECNKQSTLRKQIFFFLSTEVKSIPTLRNDVSHAGILEIQLQLQKMENN